MAPSSLKMKRIVDFRARHAPIGVSFAPNPDTGAPLEADIAQHAFSTMGERPGGSPVQEHPRVLQKDARML
jgi:hypothetical protein